MALNIFLTLLLVFLNAFFVAAEFALVKVRLSQIEMKIRSGSKMAELTKNLISNLDSYLSATQLGITLASLGLGWIGEPVVAVLIIDTMNLIGIQITQQLAHTISIPVAFILITALHIIFGEQAPKSLAIQKSEQFSIAISVPLKLFYIIFKPLIWTLNYLSNRLLKLLGFETSISGETLHSADEIRFLLEEGSKSGAIEPAEHRLLENIFDFSDTPVKQIMVPRRNIIAIEVSLSKEEILRKCIDEGYSRIPVYETSIDNIVGVIYTKDLVKIALDNSPLNLKRILRPAFSVQETEKIDVLLKDFQKQHVHLAIVLDEFGGTAGIVTIEDIIEEIVGEIQDEYDEETPAIEKLSINEFLIKANTSVNDINDYLNILLPESDDYETLGGLLTSHLGRIPESNERIEFDKFSVKIIKRSKRQIETVKLIIKESNPTD